MSDDKLLQEAELLPLLVKGDESAFLTVYKEYSSGIFSFILKYVNSTPLAEDLVQEVFLKIWESRKNLKHVRSLKAYLFITARNHTLNSLKKASRSEAALGEIVNSYIALRNNTEDCLLEKEYKVFLDKVLAALPERSRRIFRLCREQGKSYEEVAAIMGISRNAVKNHMVFSMKVLRSSTERELGVSLSLLLCLLYKY